MKILCVSASNVLRKKAESASTRACEIVRELIAQTGQNAIEVEVISLVDYDVKPCIMCGECLASGVCNYDPSFNAIYSQFQEAEGIFVVCPHYAPIPSKLIMVLEKIEEICYLAYCSKSEFALKGKAVALIGHGGGTGQEIEDYYRQALLRPLAQAFLACGMDVVGPGETQPKGIVFGVTGIQQRENTVLPDMVHDWDEIRNRMEPLVQVMMERLGN